MRPDTLVISTVAGLPRARLAPLLGEAELVTAMPISAAEYGESPTLLYPDHPAARSLLEHLGEVIAVSSPVPSAPRQGWRNSAKMRR